MATAKSKAHAAPKKSKPAPHRKPRGPTKSTPNPRRTVPATVQKSASKVEKPGKPIFKELSICSIGIFRRNDKVISHEDISKWIRIHGGEHIKEVTDTTTHLICSIEEFKKGSVQVQRAQRLGKRRCHIVVWDWVEDCLLGRKNKKSRRPEKMYTLDRVMTRLESGKQIDATFFRRFDEGVKASQELVDNNLYHIYSDHDGFEYKIILSRVQVGNGQRKNTVEKYTLYLFESHAIPHVFMVGAKLSRNSRANSYWRDQCHPMDFAEAFKHFKKFFHEKTGIEWDMRLEPPPEPHKLQPATIPKKRGMKACTVAVPTPISIPIADVENLKFVYARPYHPRPLGLLPWDYVLPEDRPGFIFPKLIMEPDNETSFDTADMPSEHEDEMSGNETNHPGNSIGCPLPVGYDSDSEVESDDEDNDHEGDRTNVLLGSRGRTRSHEPIFSTESVRSESALDTDSGFEARPRSRSDSTSTIRYGNHEGKTNNKRNRSRSGYGSDSDTRSGYLYGTTESTDSASSLRGEFTNLTHSSTQSDSNSSAISNSGESSSEISGTTSYSRQGKQQGERNMENGEATESSDGSDITDDEVDGMMTLASAQRNGQRQSQRGDRRNATQSRSQRQPQHRRQSQSQYQAERAIAQGSRGTRQGYDYSDGFAVRNPSQASAQNHKENSTQQQWQHQMQSEIIRDPSQDLDRGVGGRGRGTGAFGGDWGFGGSNTNGFGHSNNVYEGQNIAYGNKGMNAGGLGMQNMHNTGQQAGFGGFCGSWGYGGMNASMNAGMNGSAMHSATHPNHSQQYPAIAYGMGNDSLPGTYGINPASGQIKGGGNGAPSSFSGYQNMPGFQNGPWGGAWGTGHEPMP